jgi:hypothetical protein
MIMPSKISDVVSRTQCIPYDENGMLPIFTSPMSTIIDEKNYQLFKDNNIYPILPRNIDIQTRRQFLYNGEWVAYSLNSFHETFCNEYDSKKYTNKVRVVIDVANGHMKNLYDSVKYAKELHGDNLVIMTGNIANPYTYINAYEAGVDYIRCSIGAGSGCITSTQVGIHYGVASLINNIYRVKKELQRTSDIEGKKLPYIVADGGIRGYSDVIKALALGADYVMIGSLFAQMKESCAKTIITKEGKRKVFYGMASYDGQKDLRVEETKVPEGTVKYLPPIGSVCVWKTKMESYLKSAMSYTNVKDLQHFCPEFVDCVVVSKSVQDSINKTEF